MRNLFSVNVKTGENTYNRFLIRKPDEQLMQKVEMSNAQLETYRQKSGVPLWFSILKFIFLFCVFMLIAFIGGSLNNGFEEEYSFAAWALYVGAIGTVLWLIMFIIERVRFKRVAQSPEVDAFLSDFEDLNKKIKENLRIPEGSFDLDVLCRPFKVSGSGKEKRGSQFFDYLNASVWAFKEGENLCFADSAGVYAIPASAVTTIVKHKKSSFFAQWNKDEPYTAEKYKHYVKTNGYGMMCIKYHYSLQFMLGGEEWEILVPAYDVDVVTQLTGITPTE